MTVLSHLVVARFDGSVYKIFDWLTDDRVDNVDNVLSWYTVHVSLIWKVLHRPWILLSFFEKGFNAEPFVDRSEQCLDIGSFDNYKQKSVEGNTYISFCQ